MTTELDGPAYHRAREAIASCHEGQAQRVTLHSASQNDRFVYGLLGAYLLLVHAMTPKTSILYNYAEFIDTHLVPQWNDFVRDMASLEAFLVLQQLLCKNTIPSYKPSFSLALDESCFEKLDDAGDAALARQSWKRGLNGRIALALGSRQQYVDAVVRTNNFEQLYNFENLVGEMI